MDLHQSLQDIIASAQEKLEQITTLTELAQFSSQWLGKSGPLSGLLKQLSTLTAEEKKSIGQKANDYKQTLLAALQEKKSALEEQALHTFIQQQHLDPSAPSQKPLIGSLHLCTQVMHRLITLLSHLGFQHIEGPEIETDFFNFEAVNIPQHHPARDMQDTFFLQNGVLLRSHTSGVQMRALLQKKLPLRILSTGAVYRSDSDATHTPMFHQMECLMVDKNTSLSDLKGCLIYLMEHLFDHQVKVRFRSSFFPFVEPGMEVDISCFLCTPRPQKNCKICKETQWIEVLGAGMVHQRLFEIAQIKEDVTGFAFGIGIERIAMLLHAVPDLRLLFSADPRFLKQFPGD